MVHRNKRATKGRRAPSVRRGTALVEFAISLPVMLLVVFGSIEVTNQIFAKQALVTTCYEAARVTASTGSKDQGLSKANQIIAERNLSGVSVTFSPGNISTLPVGQDFSVTARMHSSQFSLVPSVFRYSAWIEATVNMVKERDE